MGDLVKGIFLLGIAGLLVWFFYSVYINARSRIGFIDSDRMSYIKGSGTVVEKQITNGGRELKFTYPEDGSSFQGILLVSEEEFDRAKIGDKIPIFYGIHAPHLWMPIKSGKIYYLSVVVIVAAAALFLTGAFFIYRTIT
jgi:hypothetical protein